MSGNFRELSKSLYKGNLTHRFTVGLLRRSKQNLLDARRQFKRERLRKRAGDNLRAGNLPAVETKLYRPTTPHTLYRRRLMNLVELDHVRLNAIRRYDTELAVRQEIRAKTSAEEGIYAVVQKKRDKRLKQVIDKVEAAGVWNMENLDRLLDDALDNPVPFGSPLARTGEKIVRVRSPATTTVTDDLNENDEHQDDDN